MSSWATSVYGDIIWLDTMISNLWDRMLSQLQSWFFFCRDALFARLSFQRANDNFKADELRDALSLSLETKIRDAINALGLPPSEVEMVGQSFDKNFAEWRMNSNLYNHTLVLLHTPTTAAELLQVLSKQAIANNYLIEPLNWETRPTEPSLIAEKLREQMGRSFPRKSSNVVVIPDLSLCFLRHAEGLNGIDFICETLLKDSTRFWVIIANTISWDYLAQVTRLNACCSDPIQLNKLSGQQLQSWLQPIIQEFSLVFSDSSFNLPQSDAERTPENQYFESLARLASGDKAIAIEIFLRSLYLSKEKMSDDKQPALMAQHPSLPSLPPLDAEDLYILYSLLLHAGLQCSALGESLGHEPIQLQPRLQKLQRSGIIRVEEHINRINVLHYPRLKQMLMNSNFAIE